MDDLNREINEQFENIKKILDKKSKEGKKTVWIIFVCDSEYCQCREFPTDKEAVIQTKYYLGVSLGNKFVSILKSKLRNIGFSSIFSSTNLFRVSDNMECYHNYILGHFLEISIVDNPFCQIL